MPVVRPLGSPAVLTPPLLTCYGISGVIHLASISLSTLLPFHLVDLGGSRTQIGVLFSVMTVVAMVLRPAIGACFDVVGTRPVMVPGVVALAACSLALQLMAAPTTIIVVMAAAGIAQALIGLPGSLLVARATEPARRGEALGLYYLASSLAIAVAPPMALGLRAIGGMRLAFAAVTVLAIGLFALVVTLPRSLTAPTPGAWSGFPLLSRYALSASLPLVLTTIGHSSIYAFLPLYVVSQGQGDAVVWFFAVYSIWVIVWRALLGGLSDRIGRVQVALPAMVLTALAYFALALPPTTASLLAAALLLGSGYSVLWPTLVALVLDRAPERERGVALGTVSAAWDLGVVIGATAIGVVADHVGFAAGFALGGVAAVLGTLVFLIAERRELRSRGPRPGSLAPGTQSAPEDPWRSSITR